MKRFLIYIFTIISVTSFAQDKDKEKEQKEALKKANNYVYEGNELAVNDDFVSAEMAYRKAISKEPTSVAGAYNLGTSYFNEGSYNEALYRLQQATKSATSKEEKYKAFHNIGNILMKENKCQEAVDAYKNALRNNPTDNETRYNLALAKKCAEDQKDDQEQQDDSKDDQNKDQDQDQNQNENKENEDQQDKEEGDNKEDNKDQGDQDKKEGDDQKDDEGKPKDDKKDQGKGDDQEKEQQKPQPQQGQLSPQQVKNLLEAMNNQEQKVQEKMNAEKQKGVKIQTEKDW
ncbi:tetratricopeptide repeat protein [Xanthomarina spongicola]|uniref:TPR repeat protein n=1 Tax=Xanthomarina spongicola TaxID=570520 RepID=A0A316DQZ5_9FLAO|nr:tetratricopeptide repeat protein [Xanthomarina spongicola]PWK20444.1 TPR repeat protein [Xanthomarina spongicola]